MLFTVGQFGDDTKAQSKLLEDLKIRKTSIRTTVLF